MKRHVLDVSLLAVLMFAGTLSSLAQDPDELQQGIKAYGTYRGGDIDSVSMTNGNLSLDIPLISYPQRGKLQLGYKLVYNGKNYIQKTMCQVDTCTTHWVLRSIGSPLNQSRTMDSLPLRPPFRSTRRSRSSVPH
jgi:hypothetical protein